MASSLNYCRLCGNSFEKKHLLRIFQKTTSCADSLDSMINQYMPFTVTTSDNLPLNVCKMCSANVIKWHRFVNLCVKAQEKLKKTLQEIERSAVGKWLESERKNSNNIKDTSGSDYVQTIIIKPQSSVAATTSLVNLVPKKKISMYCIARWCSIGNDLGISLFRVPKDRVRALQWLSAAERMDLADKDSAYLYRCYICAAHFTKEMFVNDLCKSLNPNAVPTIFPKPTYAEKIEQDMIKASTYPKELQGVRLKYILPKFPQKREEPSNGSSLISNPAQPNTPIIAMLTESDQENVEQAEQLQVFGSGVQISSTMDIFGLSSDFEDPSKSVSSLNKSNEEDYLTDQSQVFSLVSDLTSEVPSEVLPSEVSVNVIKDAMEIALSDENHEVPAGTFSDNTYMDDTFRVGQDQLAGLSDVTEKQIPESSIPNTLIDFMNTDEPYIEADNALMLELSQKSTNTNTTSLNPSSISFAEDQHVTADTFSCQVTPTGDAFSSLRGVQPFSSNDSNLLIPDGVFGLKGTMSEDYDSTHLSNIVGSQDFLLMHSSSPQVEQNQGQRLRQNADNLCTIVSESVSEPITFEDRVMTPEVNARTIECTSPTHGQLIEGLLDLDQFLNSA